MKERVEEESRKGNIQEFFSVLASKVAMFITVRLGGLVRGSKKFWPHQWWFVRIYFCNFRKKELKNSYVPLGLEFVALAYLACIQSLASRVVDGLGRRRSIFGIGRYSQIASPEHPADLLDSELSKVGFFLVLAHVRRNCGWHAGYERSVLFGSFPSACPLSLASWLQIFRRTIFNH
ncbi:hypothetical protein BpHYR1_028559 [Brachionus plicatilis]|uniref:Uncharacterized protein n=1 Tax=Brachionus plicatilis TaxID=10195 RepID=A0A3M7RU66_BRAPC|nr:hypothetical protein BpHYR1_028559 [Brachionus plicatilis]